MPVANSEWFKESDFWEQFAPIMFDEAHWAEVPAVADGITRFAGIDLYGENPETSLTSPPKALDICCGFGRISAELARMGYAVTGIDITESYLKTAREEALYEDLNIEYINSDAREFTRPVFFDVALNLYNSFGYFESQDDDLRLVKNAFSSLKKGGCLILDTFGKEITVRDFVEAEWFERAGFMVLTKYKVLDSWTLLHNRWILIKDGKKIEKTFSYRLYSAAEFRALLLEAGFSKVDIFGDWNGSPYDQYANRLIVVARKL
ncbi:MAG: class I SAM-dependent methyltransferase [Spirochaetes bacterium]|nr:class I SAM-dependent methyltransferase [Spirochaetota bacterium]